MGNAIDAYMLGLYKNAEKRFKVADVLNGGADPREWQDALRAEFRGALGSWPAPVDLNIHEIETVKRPGCTRVKLTYQSEGSLDTIAYLLIPDGITSPVPAVVACTGHGYGVREIVGITEDFKEREGAPTYQKDFGLELARRGYVVIAPEPLGFGEMMLEDDIVNKRGNSCDRISDNLLLFGRTMAGARVQQYIAAVSLLTQIKEADPNRVGAMGISGGGLTASFLTMLDPRVKALASSGYPCMYSRSIYDMHHCVDNFPIGLLNIAENDALMSLAAPRPMLWESGSKDPIFPRKGVEEAAESVKQIYAHMGATEMFEVDYFEGDHEISGKMAYAFFERHLNK
jgi:dienelactone hydrolase